MDTWRTDGTRLLVPKYPDLDCVRTDYLFGDGHAARLLRCAQSGYSRANQSVDRRMHQVRDPVQPERMPRVRADEIGQIGERNSAAWVGPRIR
jgi:hypothetical protein